MLMLAFSFNSANAVMFVLLSRFAEGLKGIKLTFSFHTKNKTVEVMSVTTKYFQKPSKTHLFRPFH